jgi:MYXO-CTERM domain-containing protein
MIKATGLALVLGLTTVLGATLPAAATTITADSDVYSQLDGSATPVGNMALPATTGSFGYSQVGFDWTGTARPMTLTDAPTADVGTDQTSATATAAPVPVPEPEGWALLLVGFGALFALPRREAPGFTVRDLRK